MKMKKFFFLMLASLLMFACEKDEPAVELPTMSFADASYNVPKGCAQPIKLRLDEPVAIDTRVPLVFAGTAVKGTDYTVEKEYIDIPAGEKEGEVIVTVKYEITESKKIEVSITAPLTGYDFGRFPKAVITTTLEQTTIFSFAAPQGEIPGDNADFTVNLYDQQGNNFNVADVTNIALNVVSTSTAVEGTHFRFVDNKKHASFLKNKSNGTFSIEVIKYEEGKNTIVLECGDANGYFPGAVPQIEITIPKRMNERIVGEWKGLDFYKLDDFAIAWGLSEQQKAALPTCTSSDILNFKADNSFTITSSGKLKNYFRNTTWDIEGSDMIVLGMSYPPEKYVAPRCNLAQVNYLFSAEAEDLKAGKVNMFITSSSEHEEILVLQINQHGNSTDFSFIWGDPLTFRFIRK